MKFRKMLSLSGLDFKQFRKSLKGWKPYFRNRAIFMSQRAERGDDGFILGRDYPCLWDRYSAGGAARGHYFWQDLYVARKLYERRPDRHVDIGSRVDGFVAHVAVFMPIEVFDIRKTDCDDRNLTFNKCNIFDMAEGMKGSLRSMSSLHTVEHFGLGRYGDEVDYDGARKGFAVLADLLADGGTFYFSVPISSSQRIEFDAHRIFSLPYLQKLVADNGLKIVDFAYVNDAGNLVRDVALDTNSAADTFGLRHGCGIFELTK